MSEGGKKRAATETSNILVGVGGDWDMDADANAEIYSDINRPEKEIIEYILQEIHKEIKKGNQTDKGRRNSITLRLKMIEKRKEKNAAKKKKIQALCCKVL